MKQKIANLEAEIEKIQAEKDFVSFSPTTQNIVTSLSSSSSTPVAKPSNKQPRNIFQLYFLWWLFKANSLNKTFEKYNEIPPPALLFYNWYIWKLSKIL